MNIDTNLKKYIETFIFPVYSKNDKGHSIEHIKYVIDRSLRFASNIDDIDYNMVYAIASYHDIGHYIDAKNHEKISAKILENDYNLKRFFNDEQIKIMKEAIEDHRASLEYEPRSIYGKILSSADRNTSVDENLKRLYFYSIEHFSQLNEDETIDECYKHALKKFGNGGYAKDKMYFEDQQYNKFLKEIAKLTSNKGEFIKRFKEVNKL